MSPEELLEKITQKVKENENFALRAKFDFAIERFSLAERVLEFDRHSDHYCVDDFLRYFDADFVLCLYQGLLKREPDNKGYREVLETVQSGGSRLKLIYAFRYSIEGKAKNVAIPDLFRRLLLLYLYRIPLIGRIFHSIIIFGACQK